MLTAMPKDTLTTDAVPCCNGLAPFSLKDAPVLIERVFPAQRVGIELQNERNAGQGQTLTSLGSYWKGRKPLVLGRACVLASLLPATDDPDGDLELFEMLMAMDDRSMARRKPEITADIVAGSDAVPEAAWRSYINAPLLPLAVQNKKPTDGPKVWPGACWNDINIDPSLDRKAKAAARAQVEAERNELRRRTFEAMPFAHKVWVCKRAENVEELRSTDDPLRAGVWEHVAERLRTKARTIPDLIEELGIAQFGRKPIVCDPFAGGGSIPFEAARIGCDVIASDLNPIASMLTWGAINVIGADSDARDRRRAEQLRVSVALESRMKEVGVEHDQGGNRAKAFLYCQEVVDPQTGWMVPMLPRLVVSEKRRVVAHLVNDYAIKRIRVEIVTVATDEEMKAAKANGTLRDGQLVYRIAPTPGGQEREWSIPVARLRGDGDGPERLDGTRGNRLRPWENTDITPRRPRWDPLASGAEGFPPGAWIGGDIFLERLYCIQWMKVEDIAAGRKRPNTFFAEPTAADLEREVRVEEIIRDRLTEWQETGFVPATTIEMGEKTEEPIRTRGWNSLAPFLFSTPVADVRHASRGWPRCFTN